MEKNKHMQSDDIVDKLTEENNILSRRSEGSPCYYDVVEDLREELSKKGVVKMKALIGGSKDVARLYLDKNNLLVFETPYGMTTLFRGMDGVFYFDGKTRKVEMHEGFYYRTRGGHTVVCVRRHPLRGDLYSVLLLGTYNMYNVYANGYAACVHSWYDLIETYGPNYTMAESWQKRNNMEIKERELFSPSDLMPSIYQFFIISGLILGAILLAFCSK